MRTVWVKCVQHARAAIAISAMSFAASACAAVDVASHPRTVQPERPSVATHAGTVAPAYVEIETGVEVDRIDNHSHSTQVPTVLKFGVAPRVQFSLLVPASSAPGVSFGLGDVAAGFKFRVIDNHPWLSDVAILPQVKFSTGDVRGTGTTDASLLFINSRTFGPVDVDFNVGVTRRSGDGMKAPRNASMFAIAAGIPLHNSLAFALECFGFPGTSGPAGSARTVSALFGPTWQVRPELALDAGLIRSIAGPQAPAWYVGLVTNLGRLPLPVAHSSKAR